MRRIAAEVAVLVLAGTAPLVAQYFGQNKVQYRTFDFRSEEHTSELQSQSNLVCRLLLEKKKNQPAERPSRRDTIFHGRPITIPEPVLTLHIGNPPRHSAIHSTHALVDPRAPPLRNIASR